MQYSEDLAQQIAKKHRINPRTIASWRHRGRIPDKYLNENFSTSKAKNASEEACQGLIAIVRHSAINQAAFASVNKQKLTDVKAGKGRFSVAQIEGANLEIAQLTAVLEEYMETFVGGDRHVRALQQIIRHPLIKPYKLFADNRRILDSNRKGLSIVHRSRELLQMRSTVAQLVNALKKHQPKD